jgi:uncharacterized protein (TIGR02186 family)
VIRWLVLVLILALWPGPPARAEEIVLGLSSDQVAITATFDGSDILIFGAVKRDGPVPLGSPLEVVITVAGPLTPVTVRHKERRLGIWINAGRSYVDAAPSFYAVATTGPLAEVLDDTEDLRYSISIPRAIRSIGNDVTNSADYTEALIRIQQEAGLFQILEGKVNLDQQTLFRTEITLPANLIEGRYDTRIFLTRDGKVIDTFETDIVVRKVGIERWLFKLAHELPFAYAALTICMAILAGWAASTAFQSFRR